MATADRPTLEKLERLVERLGPEIWQLFKHRGISELETARLVESALVTLSHRWNRVGDRERWLLKHLDEETRNRPDVQRKESEDE